MDIANQPEGLRNLIESGRKYKMPKGQIMQTSDHRVQLNLVADGYVKRYLIANDGSLSVQSIFGPGYVFPLTPAFKKLLSQSIYSGPEIIYYEAITDSEIFSLDFDKLKEAAEQNPLLYRDLFSEAGVRLADNIQRLENLALKNAYKRLAHQIAYFGRTFSTKSAKGYTLNLPLTHQDFADILSLTRETVSTSMVELRNNKLVITGKQIIIPNLEKLEEEAYS